MLQPAGARHSLPSLKLGTVWTVITKEKMISYFGGDAQVSVRPYAVSTLLAILNGLYIKSLRGEDLDEVGQRESQLVTCHLDR
jgi:hypothetical protein